MMDKVWWSGTHLIGCLPRGLPYKVSCRWERGRRKRRRVKRRRRNEEMDEGGAGLIKSLTALHTLTSVASPRPTVRSALPPAGACSFTSRFIFSFHPPSTHLLHCTFLHDLLRFNCSFFFSPSSPPPFMTPASPPPLFFSTPVVFCVHSCVYCACVLFEMSVFYDWGLVQMTCVLKSDVFSKCHWSSGQ